MEEGDGFLSDVEEVVVTGWSCLHVERVVRGEGGGASCVRGKFLRW